MSDLPVRHCTTKPRHTFCTICYRINYDVAFDCPLRELPETRQPVAHHQPVAPAPPFAAPVPYGLADPEFAPSPPPEIPDGPVIEFSRTGEAPPKRRVKAKSTQTRGPPPSPTAPPPPPPPAPEPTADDLAAELRSWDPEAPAAPLGFKAAPVAQDFERRLAAEEERKRAEVGGGGNPPPPPPPPPRPPTAPAPHEMEKARPQRRLKR